MIRNFKALVTRARSGPPRTVVVAGVENDAVIEAVRHASEEGFLQPLLVDTEPNLSNILSKFSREVESQAVNSGEGASIADLAVALINQGRGDILLKGSVSTAALMRAVLDKDRGIPHSGLLSDSFLFRDDQRKGNQLIDITDGGVVLYPDVEQKQAILENAVRLYHMLDHSSPKVAVCAAVEKVNEQMPPTVHGAQLKQRYQMGEITGCIVDGPLALDCALSKDALRVKGIESELEGEADILVMPSIEAANLVAKSTQYIGGKEAAHVIMGAEVPILIPSRSDSAKGKFLSLALASVVCGSRQ